MKKAGQNQCAVKNDCLDSHRILQRNALRSQKEKQPEFEIEPWAVAAIDGMKIVSQISLSERYLFPFCTFSAFGGVAHAKVERARFLDIALPNHFRLVLPNSTHV